MNTQTQASSAVNASTIEHLHDFFLNKVSYLSFILSKEKPIYKTIIRATILFFMSVLLLTMIYFIVTEAPPYIFILPMILIIIVVILLQNYFEKKTGFKKSKQIKMLKEHLKENKLLKKKVLKFLIHQISFSSKPATQIPPVGFAVLFTIGIYFTETLNNGLRFYTDLFRSINNSIIEREFWLMVISNTFILAGIFAIYLIDKTRAKIQNYKYDEATKLQKMLEDIYIERVIKK